MLKQSSQKGSTIGARAFRISVVMLCVFFITCTSILAQQVVTVVTPGNGNVVIPAGVTELQAECWGAGGAGGGATGFPAAGGGGAGGAYSRTANLSVSPGQTYLYRVGAGGVGSTGNGSNGERTWFRDSTLYCAMGGPGGSVAASNSFSATGGIVNQTGSLGQVVYYGGSGGTGTSNGASGGGGGGSAGTGSHGNPGTVNGGAAVAGGSAGANGSTTSSNGSSATSFGAGGAGGRTSNSLDRTGGNGGPGKLTLTFNCPSYAITTIAASNTCLTQAALVTLTANPENLPVGNYTITYNQSAPNAATNRTAAVTITTSGLAQFYTSSLMNTGSTTITLVSIQSGNGTVCGTTFSSNNTAVTNVYATPTPVIEYQQGNADTVANVSICSFANGGSGRNDMVIASGNPGGVSVIQWQVSYNMGLSWSDAQGPTASTSQYELNPVYTNVMSVAGTYYFRVVITNGPCIGISNRIRLNVTGSSTLLSGIIGTDQAFCLSGNPVALTEITPSTGGNGSYNYQWQSSTDNINFSIINGNSNPTYDPPVLSQTTYYRRITLSGGCRSFSNTVRVRIDTLFPQVPSGIYGEDTVCANSSMIIYTVDSSTDAGNYEWSVPGGWSIIASYNTDSLFVRTGLVSQSGDIRIRAQNGCGYSAWVSMPITLTNGSTAASIIAPVAVCAGSSSQISVQITGGASPYTIQYTNGIDTTEIDDYMNNAPISMTLDTTMVFRLLRVQNFGGCLGTGLHSGTTLRVTEPGTWLGLQDSSWNNANNWCGGVPGSMTNVYIPFGTIYSPVIQTTTAHARTIQIDSGAILTARQQTIRLYGAMRGAGKMNVMDATLELCATDSAQVIVGTQFLQKQIRNLRLSNSNGVVLSSTGDSLFITGILDFAASNVLFQTGGKLTMASRASGTSSIPDLTAGGLYNGNRIVGAVTVEKYIPNQPKSWQFLSVPTVGSTFKSAWQEGNAAMGNLRPGYGTIMTSHLSGATTSLGFDIFTPSGTTLKVYNSSTASWDAVSNTNSAMSNVKGYMLFVRGDRSVTAFNQAPTPTILRTTGTLYTPIDNPPPAVDIPVGVFESVGNPYPCAIDFTKLNKTGGVQNVFYMWDSRLTMNQFSAYGLGGYQTLVRDGDQVEVIPGGGGFAGNSKIIPSGQSFFVRAMGNPGQIIFTESCKTVQNNAASRETPIQNSSGSLSKLRSNLSVITPTGPVLLDGWGIRFDDAFSNTIDSMDVLKIGNSTSENIGIMKQGQRLTYERRRLVQSVDTTHLNVAQLKRQQYRFDFQPSNLNQLPMQAVLVDKYLNSTTPISMDTATIYHFSVNTDAASWAVDRFYIVYNQAVVLPVRIKSFKAVRKAESVVRLDWSVEASEEISHMEIERSKNGTDFEKLGEVDPETNPYGIYTLLDRSAIASPLFYRLKCIQKSGGIVYSHIEKISRTEVKQDGGFIISPNPVSMKELKMINKTGLVGKFSYIICDMEGRVIQKGMLNITDLNQLVVIAFGGVLNTGQYSIRLIINENEVFVESFIISN